MSNEVNKTIESKINWSRKDELGWVEKIQRQERRKRRIIIAIICVLIIVVISAVFLISKFISKQAYRTIDITKEMVGNEFSESGYSLYGYYQHSTDTAYEMTGYHTYIGRLKDDAHFEDNTWLLTPDLYPNTVYDCGSLQFYEFKLEENAVLHYDGNIGYLKDDVDNYTEQEKSGDGKNIYIFKHEIKENNNVYESIVILLRIKKSFVVLSLKYDNQISYDDKAEDIMMNIYENSTMAFTSKGLKYKLNSDKSSYSVCISHNAKYSNIEIPSTHLGKPVTQIFGEAYLTSRKIDRIIIPDSVTSIGNYAFHNCTNLTSITIPDSVTSIGYSAFERCFALISITIPDSVTSIGDRAFENCTSLESITFQKNSQLLSIGYATFNNCSSLINIAIPDSVTNIGEGLFNKCTSLTNVILGNGITELPDGYYYMSMFMDCFELTSVTIGNSVTKIGDYTFDGCKSLKKIEIPENVTSIGDHAFGYCSSLTSIVIPASVTNIGWGAFDMCTSLTIYCEAESKPNEWSDYWNYWHSNNFYMPIVWGYNP